MKYLLAWHVKIRKRKTLKCKAIFDEDTGKLYFFVRGIPQRGGVRIWSRTLDGALDFIRHRRGIKPIFGRISVKRITDENKLLGDDDDSKMEL